MTCCYLWHSVRYSNYLACKCHRFEVFLHTVSHFVDPQCMSRIVKNWLNHTNLPADMQMSFKWQTNYYYNLMYLLIEIQLLFTVT